HPTSYRILADTHAPNRVETNPGDRNRVREELPLSMRVHELAKELGLKSHELLERIQKEGLDVKVSALASLDPAMVDRIRTLVKQPGAGRETRGPAAAGAAPLRPVASGSASAPAVASGSSLPVRGGEEPLRPSGPRSTGPSAAPTASAAG